MIAHTIGATPCFWSDCKTLAPPVGIQRDVLDVEKIALDDVGEEEG